MRSLIYLMALLCLVTAIVSSIILIRSYSDGSIPKSKTQPSPAKQAPSVGVNLGDPAPPQSSQNVVSNPPAGAASPSVPVDTNSPTKNEQIGDSPRVPHEEGANPTSSDGSPSRDGARERVKPILNAIALQAENKPLRASLISDIRRAGTDAIQASMPELLNVLETDNDPGVQLVLISTMANAPDAVPISALPLIKRIVQSETAQRELRDQCSTRADSLDFISLIFAFPPLASE